VDSFTTHSLLITRQETSSIKSGNVDTQVCEIPIKETKYESTKYVVFTS